MKASKSSRLVLMAAMACAPLLQMTARSEQIELRLEAGRHDRLQSVARVGVTLPADIADAREVTLVDGMGGKITGQFIRTAIGDGPETEVARELNLIVPELKAGATLTLTSTAFHSEEPKATAGRFRWVDSAGDHDDLLFGDRPVMRYMYQPLDDSSPEKRELTYKVYHHLFDPEGKILVTKGPGGKYTHHRGLFFGFNKISYGGKTADVWHCKEGSHQSHDGFAARETGSVLGRHSVAIGWHGADKQVFARETRTMTVYNVPGGQLVDFASRVESTVGPVRLDGDPQHAGFHFRAAQEVAELTNGLTYYLRPDGRGRHGETRNWPDQKEHVNLPWDAMSFVLGQSRHTALYLDRPGNPKEARFSERDYGRFGSYFEYDLDAGKPLEIAYRVWLQAGEITPERAAAMSADFTDPITVRADWK